MRTLLRQVTPASVWSGLQFIKSECQCMAFKKRVVEHIYGGLHFKLWISDPVAAEWYDHDWERPEEFNLLARSRLRPGARVFDIGAHQGLLAMMLANTVGQSGQVIAVEALRHNVRAARRNFALNDLSIVSVHGMVGSQVGYGRISAQLNANPRLDGHGYKVPAITLDWLVKMHGHPDVVYLDIEGFEGEALKAAESAFAKTPDWCIELHGNEILGRFGTNNALIARQFLSRGYKVSIIDDKCQVLPVDSVSDLPDTRCHMVATS